MHGLEGDGHADHGSAGVADPERDQRRREPFGYLLTVAIEVPILAVGLSRAPTLARRLAAGLWLTACTYPIVVLVLPLALGDHPRWHYLVVAEIFAPLAECALFAGAFRGKGASWPRDYVVITAANLASFGLGELMRL